MIEKEIFDAWCFVTYPEWKKRGLRLGQAFIYDFMPDTSDAELWYCEDTKIAKAIIHERYII